MISLLMFLAGFAILIGWVWLMISAFAESVPWGVGIFFIPLLGLVFGFLKGDETKAPTILMGAGLVAYFILYLIG